MENMSNEHTIKFNQGLVRPVGAFVAKLLFFTNFSKYFVTFVPQIEFEDDNLWKWPGNATAAARTRSLALVRESRLWVDSDRPRAS